MSLMRSRWAAIGAAVAVTLGAGGIGLVAATGPSGAVTLVPITPCRLIDTRPGTDNVGPFEVALGAGDTFTISAHGDNGRCTGIPTGATALSLNVTAVGATQPSFFTIWPTGEPQPNSSSINPVPGEPPTPNAVTTKLSTGGQFNIFNLAGNVDVIVDLNGYYVDHDHDDRYYTKAQSDARYVASDPTPLTISLSPYDFTLVNDFTNWSFDSYFLSHAGVPGFDCVMAPIDPPVGATFDKVLVSYTTSAPVAIQAVVSEVRRDFVTGESADLVFTDNPTVPATSLGEAGNTSLAFQAPPMTARDGYEYGFWMCAEGLFVVTAVDIALLPA
jgi:hypothetical protein